MQKISDQRGFTILETLVTLGVVAAMLGAAVPRLTAGYQNADSAASGLMANLRLCRVQAVASGYHYRVNVSAASTYTVQRMQPPTSGTTWVVDTATPARTLTLPVTVRVTAGSGNYEFDSRGTTVGASALANVTLHDSGQNRDVTVQVWPSGQINRG